jgi:hypothetical protein
MTRLVLLLLLALATWVYFPETRSILADVTEPVIMPIVRWSTQEEMDQVGRNVVEHERLTGQLPTGSAWLEWLDYRYTVEDMKRDPWDSVYQIQVTRDSIAVISLGPDRTRQTPDDFQVMAARNE